jgi:hypothetical protein
MPATAFPSPVLPGKEGMPAQIGEQLKAHAGLNDFLKEGTVTMVRVYQMGTPAGDVVTTYQEADSIEQSFRNQIEGRSEVAQLLRDHIKGTHGIDITAGQSRKRSASTSASRYLRSAQSSKRIEYR